MSKHPQSNLQSSTPSAVSPVQNPQSKPKFIPESLHPNQVQIGKGNMYSRQRGVINALEQVQHSNLSPENKITISKSTLEEDQPLETKTRDQDLPMAGRKGTRGVQKDHCTPCPILCRLKNSHRPIKPFSQV